MLKSEELQQKHDNLKNEIKSLQDAKKINEAHAKLPELENVKRELEVAKAIEVSEVEEIENKIDLRKDDNKMENKEIMELRNKEEKIFANYVRSTIANDMTSGGNGAIIPTTISARIIEKVREISPLYAKATKFNIGGELVFAKEDAIPMAEYMDEMAEGGEGTDATFQTVKLTGHVIRALSKVSRSLINKTDFDLVAYVVNAVAKSIALKIEREFIVGTTGKIKGLSSITPSTVSAVNADVLVDLQMEIKTALQGGCEWLMNPATLKICRKFKTTDGQFLFNADATSEFGYRILGKNVMLSDQCPTDKVFYGDFSGLYAKLENNIEVQVLKEKYADQFAYGVLGFVQLDADVVETQNIKAIKVGA